MHLRDHHPHTHTHTHTITASSATLIAVRRPGHDLGFIEAFSASFDCLVLPKAVPGPSHEVLRRVGPCCSLDTLQIESFLFRFGMLSSYQVRFRVFCSVADVAELVTSWLLSVSGCGGKLVSRHLKMRLRRRQSSTGGSSLHARPCNLRIFFPSTRLPRIAAPFSPRPKPSRARVRIPPRFQNPCRPDCGHEDHRPLTTDQ